MSLRITRISDFGPPAAGAICAQCGAGTPDDPPTIKVMNGDGAVWVHDGCLKFWKGDHPQSQISKQEN